MKPPRNKILTIRFTEREVELIKANMVIAGYKEHSSYIRSLMSFLKEVIK